MSDDLTTKRKRDRLKTLTAIGGFAFGLLGITISIVGFLRDRPNLEVHVESAGTPSVTLGEVKEALNNVEARAGTVTGSLIESLQQKADSTLWSDSKSVSEFISTLQQRIDTFDKALSWNPEDIRFNGSEVIWPDGTVVNLKEASGAASFPSSLVSKLLTAPSPSDIQLLQEKAHEMHRGVDSPEASAAAATAAEALRALRIRLNEIVDERQQRLVIRITVRNRSALPTYITRDAAITIDRSGTTPRTIDLMVLDGGLLGRYSVGTFLLESRAFDKLDETDRQAISQALGSSDGKSCVVQVRDLHDEYWPGFGRIGGVTGVSEIEEFHRRGARLIAEVRQ